MFTAEELLPVKLTLELALITTVFLLLVATPLAWWLSHTKSKWRAPISSIVTLPLVLPPSVLGFYLLVAMGPSGPLGKLTEALGIGLLTFTFPGLVIGSDVCAYDRRIRCCFNDRRQRSRKNTGGFDGNLQLCRSNGIQ